MALHRPAPAAPDATKPTTPPAAETGAGTSPDSSLTGDGKGDALPPVSNELKEFTPAPKPVPGASDFDINAPGVSSAELQEHLSIRSLRKQLADLDKPAALAAPVPVTVVDTPVASFAAPSAALIGKQDSLTGLVQQLPQKLWDQLSPEDSERFTDIPVQPAKPADLT